jgi:naphtho-gamma-pyrone polyketide synthase
LADFLSTLSRPRISTSLSSITAPYHAAHLYSDADVAHVLGALPARASWTSTTIPIISAAEGQDDARRAAALFPDALGEAVRDCLLRRIAIDRLPVRIADHVQSLGKDDAVIHPVANPTAERLGPAIRNLLCSDKTSPPASLSETPPQYEPANAESPAAKSPIAILSASGRFPGRADSMDLFWKILSEGVDTHELVPATRWNAAAHVSENPKAKNVSGTGFGCWLHSAASFDVNYFNMSPREAPQVDPAQRLALLTATEALELAGIVPDRTSSTQKNRVGVYFGCTSNDWMVRSSSFILC